MNDMADDTWDSKAVNRISAIHFLDDDEDDDDEKVRPASTRANFIEIHLVVGVISDL